VGHANFWVEDMTGKGALPSGAFLVGAGQGCIKLSILSLRGTSGERTEERGKQ
jgi:hypothetical protein